MNPTPAPYRFHAFEVSYFSAKVRPALRLAHTGPRRPRARAAALSGTGWEAALDYTPRHRLGKRGFRLAFEPL